MEACLRGLSGRHVLVDGRPSIQPEIITCALAAPLSASPGRGNDYGAAISKERGPASTYGALPSFKVCRFAEPTSSAIGQRGRWRRLRSHHNKLMRVRTLMRSSC